MEPLKILKFKNYNIPECIWPNGTKYVWVSGLKDTKHSRQRKEERNVKISSHFLVTKNEIINGMLGFNSNEELIFQKVVLAKKYPTEIIKFVIDWKSKRIITVLPTEKVKLKKNI